MRESRWWWAASSCSRPVRRSYRGWWSGGLTQPHQPPPRRDPRLELHNADAWRDPEARPPRPARIHHRDRPIHQLEQRLVGVTIYDDLGPRKRRMQLLRRRVAELIAVRHHDRETVELELGHLGQPRPQLGTVRIPVHRRDRRQRLEVDQELGLADVTAVQDVVDSFEHLENLGPQQPVSVRDHPDSHFTLLQRGVVASCNYVLPSQRFTSAMSSPR